MFLIHWNIAKANVIAQQIIFTQNTSLSNDPVQTLGTGLSGTLKTLTVKMTTNWNPARNVKAVVTCYNDSAYSSSCGNTNPNNMTAVTLPSDANAHDLIFDFTSESFTFQSGKYYRFATTGQGNTSFVYGSNSNPYANGSCIQGCSSINDLYFVIDDGITFVPLTINNPPEWARTFPLDFNIPVDGTCPDNGTSTIVLSFPNGEYLDEGINCISNLFSISLPARDYGDFDPTLTSSCWLPDHTVGCQTDFSYKVDPNFNDYYIGINYPRNSQNGIDYKLQTSSAFPFVYAYRLPPGIATSTVDFYLQEYTSATFDSASGTPFHASVTSLGLVTSGLPAISDNHVVVGATQKYYKAWLQTPDSVVQAWKIFTTIADSSGDSPVAPQYVQGNEFDCGGGIMGQLCSIFIPPTGYFTTQWNDFTATMQEKLPFYFYFQLKDTFNSLSASTTVYSFNFPMMLGNGTVTPISISTSGNTLFTTIHDYAYPIMQALLWIGFGFWLFKLGLSFRP